MGEAAGEHVFVDGNNVMGARGVPFGRPPKLRPEQRTLARQLIEEGKSVSDVARTFNVHVATNYRCLHHKAPLSQYTVPLARTVLPRESFLRSTGAPSAVAP